MPLEIRFLGQGLNTELDRPVGEVLVDSLESGVYTSFTAYVGFAGASAVQVLTNALEDFAGEFRVFVGIDQHGTTVEALRCLATLGHSFVFYTPSPITYHPKIYMFSSEEQHRIVIGSSNLQISGLFTNVEASVQIDFTTEDSQGMAFLNSLTQYFASLADGTDPNVEALTGELIEDFCTRGLVLLEMEQNQRRSAATGLGQSSQDDAEAQSEDSIGSRFPSRPRAQLPARVRELFARRRAEDSEIVHEPDGRDPNEAVLELSEEQNVDDTPTAFWLESGSMTGGSHTQLELAKRGVHADPGTVHFFGLRPGEYAATTSFAVNYNGETYTGHQLRYRGDNGMWRIDFSGRNSTGQRMVFRGNSHEFQHKILVFERIAESYYNLQVLDPSLLADVINQSEWTDNTTPSQRGPGRNYGVLREGFQLPNATTP